MDGIAQVQARISEIQSRFPSAPMFSVGGSSATSFAQALSEAQGGTAKTGATSRTGGITGKASGSAEEAVVSEARKYLGVPYVWGGTDGNKGLDCSGLTQLAYKNLGIDIPRVSSDQARGGKPVASVAQARPGDLVFYDYSSSRAGIDHVGMYIGNGKIIEAARPGTDVRISDVGNPAAIRRYLPTAPVAASAASSTGGAAGKLAGVPYGDLFAQAGARFGVPAALLAGVAKTESGFNPNAVSSAGARGLMQFMPGTAKDLGINPLSPADAINGAARYLSSHLREFGSTDLALAAYNAGPGAVRKYGGVPPYSETQNYVRKVNDAWQGYR